MQSHCTIIDGINRARISINCYLIDTDEIISASYSQINDINPNYYTLLLQHLDEQIRYKLFELDNLFFYVQWLLPAIVLVQIIYYNNYIL